MCFRLVYVVDPKRSGAGMGSLSSVEDVVVSGSGRVWFKFGKFWTRPVSSDDVLKQKNSSYAILRAK